MSYRIFFLLILTLPFYQVRAAMNELLDPVAAADITAANSLLKAGLDELSLEKVREGVRGGADLSGVVGADGSTIPLMVYDYTEYYNRRTRSEEKLFEILSFLISQDGVNVDAVDPFGCTCLMHAAYANENKIFELLFKKAARIDIRCEEQSDGDEYISPGFNALMTAVSADNEVAFGMLLEKSTLPQDGISTVDPDCHILGIAAYLGNLNIVSKLLPIYKNCILTPFTFDFYNVAYKNIVDSVVEVEENDEEKLKAQENIFLELFKYLDKDQQDTYFEYCRDKADKGYKLTEYNFEKLKIFFGNLQNFCHNYVYQKSLIVADPDTILMALLSFKPKKRKLN